MINKQLEYVIEVLEREVSGYSDEFAPERINLIKDYVNDLRKESNFLSGEYEKCKADIVYFAETYVKIDTMAFGLTKFKPWNYQKDLLRHLQANKSTISKMRRQSGKTTCGLIAILHEVLFGDAKNIAIISHRLNSAQDILRVFNSMYEELPLWLKKVRLLQATKSKLVFRDGFTIMAMSANASCIKATTYDMILLDEFAFTYQEDTIINNNKYWLGLMPVEYNPETRLIMLSSLASKKRTHYFNKLWLDALNGKNDLSAFNSDCIDGHEDERKFQMLPLIGEKDFDLEYECKIEEESP